MSPSVVNGGLKGTTRPHHEGHKEGVKERSTGEGALLYAKGAKASLRSEKGEKATYPPLKRRSLFSTW